MCAFLLDWDFSACYESSNVHMIWSLLKSAISTAICQWPVCLLLLHLFHCSLILINLGQCINPRKMHTLSGVYTLPEIDQDETTVEKMEK